MASELVKELRAEADGGRYGETSRLHERAAACIEALEAALKPFADEATTYDCDDDVPVELVYLIPSSLRLRIEEGDGTLTESIITVGDLRRARETRAALAEPSNRD